MEKANQIEKHPKKIDNMEYKHAIKKYIKVDYNFKYFEKFSYDEDEYLYYIEPVDGLTVERTSYIRIISNTVIDEKKEYISLTYKLINGIMYVDETNNIDKLLKVLLQE